MKDNISEKPFNIPFVKVQNFDKRSLKKHCYKILTTYTLHLN